VSPPDFVDYRRRSTAFESLGAASNSTPLLNLVLGASPREISTLILRRGAALGGAGVALGILASVGLTRLFSAVVFGVGLVDPITLVAASGTLILVALVASDLPSRRVMQMDPVAALRHD
jgi:ABC-type antimicrobial peptide transport system permease subunit